MIGSSITLSLADWPGYKDFKVLDMCFFVCFAWCGIVNCFV